MSEELYTLPSYREIPDVGLYLEQAVRYVNSCLVPIGLNELTASMVSNYVKQKVIENPVRKLYYARHIAQILFVAVAKTVVSIEDMRLLMMQVEPTENPGGNYEFFRVVFQKLMNGNELPEVEENSNIRNLVISVTAAAALVISLGKRFREIRTALPTPTE